MFKLLFVVFPVTTDKSTNSKMRIQNLFECLQLKSDNSENDDDELKLRGGLAVADKADDEVERNSSSDDVIESVVVQEDETNNISERTEEEEEKKGLLTPETPVKVIFWIKRNKIKLIN